MKMPVNPTSDEWLARRAIDKLITVHLRSAKSMDFDDVVHQVSLAHKVTIGMIEAYIKRFYVNKGRVSLSDGVLRWPDD